MSAIRLARGYTGRDKIVKFEGCYHGHSDSLLVKAGSGALTLGEPSSPGVPASLAEHTVTLDYNNREQVKETFEEIGEQMACIIVEPVAGNMNCIPPVAGFLEGLREVCDQYGTVLILDEVMTGFRVSLGGAQGHLWDYPRPHHTRQGNRRRHACRRLRWKTRDHGEDRPSRPRLPGWHPLRQSCGDDRGPQDPRTHLCPWLLRKSSPPKRKS